MQNYPSWLRVLCAPAIDLFRPRLAAKCLAAASRPAFVAIFLLSLLAYAVVLICLILWDSTVTQIWVPAQSTATSTAPTTTWAGDWEVRERTIGEVWRDWRASAFKGWIGTAEITLALVLILGPILVLLLGWLNLPLVHGTGSVWRSYKRSLRAGTAFLWPLTVLTVACGTVLILAVHAGFRGFSGRPLWLVSISSATCVLALWLRRAVRAVASGEPEQTLPPRCEGCGYNLTHQPAEGRCSECGLALDDSLVAWRSRLGSAWARQKSVSSWVRTVCDVLFRPRAFYRAIKLRTPPAAAEAFAAWNYVLLPLGALLWTVVLFVLALLKESGPKWYWIISELPWIAWNAVYICAMILFGLCWCWLGQRVLAALVVSWWLARQPLPDFRWAVKVMAYETAYLWTFLFYWGALRASFVLDEMWISKLLGIRYVTVLGSMPVEFAVFLFGTLGLVVIWLWRYRIAHRAIRWSNF
ncbi:MAG: hypothetical protein KAY37_04010 [Phycisphaerae bacterium]|nr:hypothetical protein [Phycisphaerae bacterium]